MIRTAIGPFLFVTSVLTGVIWIVQALRFVDEIINYDMTASAFAYISLLLLPQLLPVTMPIGLFCGLLGLELVQLLLEALHELLRRRRRCIRSRSGRRRSAIRGHGGKGGQWDRHLAVEQSHHRVFVSSLLPLPLPMRLRV